jgi:hypothetical protein
MVEGLGSVIGTLRPATIALLNHKVRSILHQKELKEAHPLIVEKFTWPNESDSVGYVVK